ncbi:Non-heme 11 kDa protein of cytochrome bc1 complex [Aureobasidium sp. EXF-8845]|nr:Non-heme 11 kDa protein of cytochrome bc1 complex [Aureobasidium sp. EXF-8845]KAI4796626.1 Non-heme 11 kDa protein of cytochrome bc1 complex [Aureobasidium sp. EXF-8846]
MGIFDYVSDLYSSLSVQSAEAEVQDDLKYASGDMNSGEDHQKLGTAEQTRGATTRGGVSLDSPAAGTDEESGAEAEANKQDAKKPEASNEKGHVAGSGGEGSGQVGADSAGPHGGPVGKQTDDEDDEEEEEAEDEDDEEEDEPEDPKPKIEEECAKSAECAPHKHHYDHCVERVTKQQEENGKADEDCVEEFFHLAHCATACAAPKLFKQLR